MIHRNDPPRVAAIHDLSCFGRCALTVVIPILSAMGAQVIPIPTALLSSHTGGFDNLHFRDLTEDMRGIISHFGRLGLRFDAIYSGFLGSLEQIDIVSEFIDNFGDGIPVLVDPVMGDDGVLYSTYTKEMAAGMGRLCHKATVITPNITEACLLAGVPMPSGPLTEAGAAELAEGLTRTIRREFGDKEIVITGIHYDADGRDMIANACASPGKPLRLVSNPRLPRSFPGTGDIFSSVLLGSMLQNGDLGSAIEKSTDFTHRVIAASQDSPSPTRDGVLLEKFLMEL